MNKRTNASKDLLIAKSATLHKSLKPKFQNTFIENEINDLNNFNETWHNFSMHNLERQEQQASVLPVQQQVYASAVQQQDYASPDILQQQLEAALYVKQTQQYLLHQFQKQQQAAATSDKQQQKFEATLKILDEQQQQNSQYSLKQSQKQHQQETLIAQQQQQAATLSYQLQKKIEAALFLNQQQQQQKQAESSSAQLKQQLEAVQFLRQQQEAFSAPKPKQQQAAATSDIQQQKFKASLILDEHQQQNNQYLLKHAQKLQQQETFVAQQQKQPPALSPQQQQQASISSAQQQKQPPALSPQQQQQASISSAQQQKHHPLKTSTLNNIASISSFDATEDESDTNEEYETEDELTKYQTYLDAGNKSKNAEEAEYFKAFFKKVNITYTHVGFFLCDGIAKGKPVFTNDNKYFYFNKSLDKVIVDVWNIDFLKECLKSTKIIAHINHKDPEVGKLIANGPTNNRPVFKDNKNRFYYLTSGNRTQIIRDLSKINLNS